MITIEHLTKRYGNFVAVNDLTLRVEKGEIFGFLGVNGAGKTTTLRMLAGVLKPTAGNITIGQYDLAKDPQSAKRITGFIPDRPHLYSKLTGYEFLRFVCDLYEVEPSKGEERIEQLLSDYRLNDWRDELIEGFSHGMKQRLATCAALVHDPKVLIVDEPMVGLDPHGTKLLKQALRQYANQGMSILLSTHSLNVAQEVSDRLAIINHGQIIALGTFNEIRSLSGGQDNNLEEIFLELTTLSPEMQ